jgi:hypothetical protein
MIRFVFPMENQPFGESIYRAYGCVWFNFIGTLESKYTTPEKRPRKDPNDSSTLVRWCFPHSFHLPNFSAFIFFAMCTYDSSICINVDLCISSWTPIKFGCLPKLLMCRFLSRWRAFFCQPPKEDRSNNKKKTSSGWWFGTFGLFFHSVGNFIIPTVYHSIIFQRGRAKNHQPEFVGPNRCPNFDRPEQSDAADLSVNHLRMVLGKVTWRLWQPSFSRGSVSGSMLVSGSM